MKTIFFLLVLFHLFGLISCIPRPSASEDSVQNISGTSYIPINPVVCEFSRNGDTILNCNLLAALPSETVFLSILDAEASVNGNIAVEPVNLTSSTGNNTYEVIWDYIKYGCACVDVLDELRLSNTLLDSLYNKKLSTNNIEIDTSNIVYYAKSIPVYYGVGVRLRATVTTTAAGVDIGTLSGIAAGFEANKLTGTLTLQALGLSGRAIYSAIPLPSEINRTTIQNALMAMGSIKSLMYDESVVISPCVVGYLRPNINYNNVDSDYYTWINIILLQHLINDPINILNDVKNAPDCF